MKFSSNVAAATDTCSFPDQLRIGEEPVMYEDGRLYTRPIKPKHRMPAGVHGITLRSGGTGLLHIPGNAPDGPLPFVLLLHGAGARAHNGLALLASPLISSRLVLLAPQARDHTWDGVGGAYGPDVETIDDLLAVAFARFEADPTRLAIGGFSDGASYALSLGVANGHLFTHVLAFSPGFVRPSPAENPPCVFISHGRHDPVLPIERCSGRIAAALRAAGCAVDVCEFDGGHEVPEQVRARAVRWLEQGTRTVSSRATQEVT
jgi:phospholipase/carboxylesterase